MYRYFSRRQSLYDALLERYKDFEVYWGMEQDEEILKVLEKKEARFGPQKGMLLKMANHYLRLDRGEEAKDVFSRVTEEEKTTIEYYKIKGEIALRNDDNVAAEDAFLLAYSVSPLDVDVLDRLADMYSEQDDYEKEADYLEQLNAIDPEYQIVQFRLAIARFQIGEKKPIFGILNQITDEEMLHLLLGLFAYQVSKEKSEYKDLSREELMVLFDEVIELRAQSIKSAT